MVEVAEVVAMLTSNLKLALVEVADQQIELLMMLLNISSASQVDHQDDVAALSEVEYRCSHHFAS